MRFGPLVFPVIALALAGLWIANQHRSISTLEEANAALQRHLVVARSSSPATGPKPGAATQATKTKVPLEWEKIAAQLLESDRSGLIGDLRTMTQFQQRLQTMSKEELCAALDEIAALDLPAKSRATLGLMFLEPLAAKDPELALTRFVGGVQDDSIELSWQLSNILKPWATKDPAKASAWLDQEIATGKFDSKSLDGHSISRNFFEASLIDTLLGTAPDEASRRLGAISPELRVIVLSQHPFEQLKEENQLAFGRLVREQVPENQQMELISRQASNVGFREGFAGVTRFMDRIAATPAERVAWVEQSAGSLFQSTIQEKKVTREDLDTLREWTTRQAPASTDRITGNAIANAMRNGRKLDYAAASELALHYHQASGNDDVLISFLDGLSGGENTEQARALAAKITDTNRRQEILKKLQ
jgi:hypothetical protein